LKKIYFRADASATIGYGHFIRTLALADMLKDDFDCTFFTCHPTPYQVSEMEKVCPHKVLNESTHLDEFQSYLQGDEIVVLDNYFFTTEYQYAIKARGCKLVCVDDMHNKHYVADVVINHALADSALFDVEPYTKLCLGLNWALLRRPFIEAVNQQHSRTGRIENVTITFGGVDWNDFTGYYIRESMNLPTVSRITAVVGDAYHPKTFWVDDKRVKYLSLLSAQEMADLFCSSDLVICPASTVSIEAIACGAKLAVGWYVDNQVDYYSVLQESNAIIPLGCIAEIPQPIKTLDLIQKGNIEIKGGIGERYIALFKEL